MTTSKLPTEVKRELDKIKSVASKTDGDWTDAFTKRTDGAREIGVHFLVIVTIEQKVKADATPASVWSKYEANLKASISRTALLNEAVPFARLSESKFASVRRSFLRVGCGDGSKDSSGRVKRQASYLGKAAIASAPEGAKTRDAGKWDPKTGVYKSGGRKKKVKPSESKRNAATAWFDSFTGEAGWESVFDLRYLGEDDLDSLEEAIRQARIYIKNGGEPIPVPDLLS